MSCDVCMTVWFDSNTLESHCMILHKQVRILRLQLLFLLFVPSFILSTTPATTVLPFRCICAIFIPILPSSFLPPPPPPLPSRLHFNYCLGWQLSRARTAPTLYWIQSHQWRYCWTPSEPFLPPVLRLEGRQEKVEEEGSRGIQEGWADTWTPPPRLLLCAMRGATFPSRAQLKPERSTEVAVGR